MKTLIIRTVGFGVLSTAIYFVVRVTGASNVPTLETFFSALFYGCFFMCLGYYAARDGAREEFKKTMNDKIRKQVTAAIKGRTVHLGRFMVEGMEGQGLNVDCQFAVMRYVANRALDHTLTIPMGEGDKGLTKEERAEALAHGNMPYLKELAVAKVAQHVTNSKFKGAYQVDAHGLASEVCMALALEGDEFVPNEQGVEYLEETISNYINAEATKHAPTFCADCGKVAERPVFWMGTSARCESCHAFRMSEQ